MNLNRFRQAFGGITIALLLTLLTLGGFNTALREIGSSSPTSPAQTPFNPSPQPNAPFTLRPSEPTRTPTPPPPTPTNCPPPQGWVIYVVQTEDTLNTLASQTGISANDIIAANCLYSSQLVPGSILYLPPQPTLPPPTPIPCGPPPGWVRYTVQPGDTLYRLSLNFGVSINQLQVANCLGSSIYIQAGQSLFVPNIPTRTPSPTTIATETATFPPASTTTLAPPTETATLTAPPTTFTNTPERPTLTPTQPNTNTPIPETNTPTVPTPTETTTSTPTATLTPTPATETATPTAQPPSETASPTPEPTIETPTVEPATITPAPTP